MSAESTIYVVVLNWNGWADTIECLESVFRSDFPRFRVIVCDNDSQDSSVEKLALWAEGLLVPYLPPGHPLRHLSWPPLPKPIPYRELPPGERLDDGEGEEAQLVVIRTGANLGFAGGNNVGLRYALSRPDCSHVWLLNNDTVVEPTALGALHDCAVRHRKARVGLVSSKLLCYHAPGEIQAVGGRYNRFWGSVTHPGAGAGDDGGFDSEKTGRGLDYPVGASLLVSREFVDAVGLLCEEYFLYFEELDWTLRAVRQGWGFRYCWQSRVYHKEGASSGGTADGEEKSLAADFWGLRNRLVFTRKFYPLLLPTVYLGFVAVILNRIRRRQFDRLPMILAIMLNKTKRGAP